MSDADAFDSACHDIYEKEADFLTVVGPGPDESGEFGVAYDPLSSLVGGVKGIVIDEVSGILEAVDGEQPGGGESVAELDAADESIHHVDEETGDIDSVVGVFEYVF